MAGGDYRSCDVCGGKAFYDADLNYETGKRIDGEWVYPETPYKIAGVRDSCDTNALGNVGDWAVICSKCSKTHRTAILPILQET